MNNYKLIRSARSSRTIKQQAELAAQSARQYLQTARGLLADQERSSQHELLIDGCIQRAREERDRLVMLAGFIRPDGGVA